MATLLAASPAGAERPATSAIAAVDNLLGDLSDKRWPAAVNALAPRVGLVNVPFRDACKKAFDKAFAARSVQLAKCLATDVQWPTHRLMGTEKPIKDGWQVSFDTNATFLVRKRKGGAFEVYDIAIAGMSRL